MPVEADVDVGKIESTEQALAVIEEYNQVKTAELVELTRKYNVVEAVYQPGGQSYILMAERGNAVSSDKGFPEMGFIDPSPFTAWTRLEHVAELRDRKGLRTFYDMSRSDGAVRGALRIIKTPIQGAEWYMEPASESKIDINIAKFVEKNLFEELDTTWERFIEDCLRCIDYGYFAFEKVLKYDYADNKIKIAKFAPLHPLDVQGWEYDAFGNLIGIRMEPLAGEDIRETKEITYERALMMVFEMEGGDLRGTSILRTAFKHWYYKDTLYKIDAIQKERHGIGVPVIVMPLGFTDNDRTLANDLGRNLRTNERAYITIPNNWEVYFAKLEGQPVDPIPSIEHHDKKIYEAILASFMGSGEVSTESLDTFYKSTRYIARCIAATINRWVIRDLVDMNFLRKGGYPKLCVRRMGEWEDMRTMTFALRNLVGAHLLTPDDGLEDLIRTQMGLPPLDPTTAREIGGPGGMVSPDANTKPPKTQGSRQKALPPSGPPKGNYGGDRTGG
jgi:hypothetical protein